MSVEGFKFVITGGASGIGAATAALAASQGAIVTVTDIDDVRGKQTVEDINASGGVAHFLRCDITDDAELAATIDQAAELMGGIDVMHNNAGVNDQMFQQDFSLATYQRSVWDKVIAINLTAPMVASQAALPYLKQSAYASIINCGSTATFVGHPHNIAYCASKGGVGQLTKTLAIELAPFGIRVNCYCPGTIETPMIARVVNAAADPEVARRAFVDNLLTARLGTPAEVAELVCFLASKSSSFVNGAVWPIDGGKLAWRGVLSEIGM
jgi:NAD(P)-dependent dehydrogenase (short-subunit alcohol dehydrogenase family)